MLLPAFSHIGRENTETEITVIKAPDKDRHPYQQEYEEMLYPSVRITTATGVGSGVVIKGLRAERLKGSKDNPETLEHLNIEAWILTAAHVVGNESTVQVEFFHHRDTKDTEEIQASVVITDTNKDLALLTTNAHELTRIYSAKLAPRNYQPYLFTEVWTVGCSLGLPPRPSFGHITSIDSGAFVSIRGYEISAPILPGNSGGPVYDAKTHEVIGIAVWVRVYRGQLITTMAGVVPIQTVYEFLESIESKESDSKDSTNSLDSSD